MKFAGYQRADGSVGVRNDVVVLPTIGCANELAHRIAKQVPGTVALLHNHACIRVGKDARRARTTLVGMGKNPNVHSVLLVGLGCEPVLARELGQEIAVTGKEVRWVEIEADGDYDAAVEKGTAILRELVEKAGQEKRTDCDVSRLKIGIKCGGSGAVSAIASNPAVGEAADLLVARKGIVMFTETAELIGAEKVFAARGRTPQVEQKILDAVQRMKDEIARCGVDILGSEPTKGNIANGLTTIEEKSLGAIAKGGTTPVVDVLEYAQEPKEPGLYFMDGTTQASQLFLGMFAAGAQIQIFSFGGGTPARIRGLPSYPPGLRTLPVIKVLGSCEDERELPYFDIYAGNILKGTESIQQVGRRIFDKILQVAQGETTVTENTTDYTEMLQVYADGLLM